MSYFSDHEPALVNGSVVGLRRFSIRDDGSLVGPMERSAEFTSGLNHAECRDVNGATWAAVKRDQPDHTIGMLNCTCGFYAYYDPDWDEYAFADTTLGIIEGYGRVTAGTRGFRAEKCKIVALVDPTLTKSGKRRWHPIRWMNNHLIRWANHGKSSISLLAALFIGAAGLILTENVIVEALYYVIIGLMLLRGVGMWVHLSRLLKGHSIKLNLEADYSKVHKKYPDVKYYLTKEEMLTAHPLTEVPAAERVPKPPSQVRYFMPAVIDKKALDDLVDKILKEARKGMQ